MCAICVYIIGGHVLQLAYDLLAAGEHTHVFAKHARLCTPRHSGRSRCFVKFSLNVFLLIQKFLNWLLSMVNCKPRSQRLRRGPGVSRVPLGLRGTACLDRVAFESPTVGALPFEQSNRHVHEFFFFTGCPMVL
jgi:hypothetical protein